MELENVLEKMQGRAAKVDPIGNTIKFNMGDQSVFIDGTGETNTIEIADKDADCTISMTKENFEKLISGDLNPMTALMMGKIKIEGDMSVALKLQSLIS